MTALAYVFLAGIGNSGPEHWQMRWYEDLRRTAPAFWIAHDEWSAARRDRWVTELDAVMRETDALRPPQGPVVFVAHSLGCLLAAEWLDGRPASNVGYAFLVAPPDTSGPSFPKDVSGFRDASTVDALPCRTAIVASRDDPFSSFEHSRTVARRWHARLADVGRKGHINASSGLGAWPEGRALLRALLEDGA